MPYRKIHPGLDRTINDDALDAFIDGIPLALEEPPPRRWPTIVGVGLAGTTIGVVTGVLVAEFVTVTQVLIVVAAILTTVALIVRADRY